MKKLLTVALIVAAGLFMLSASNVFAQGEPCTADFNCDGNVDATDVTTFLSQFGRSPYNDPCPDCYDSQCPCSTCVTCEGTLSTLGRWCDQLNGTVKDMTTGLVWLKMADWGGQKPWADCSTWDDAHTRAAQLWDGSPYEGTAGLSDGSIEGDWRLPTKTELVGITEGTEYIRLSSMYFFTGVQHDPYWSSTTLNGTDFAWNVVFYDGGVYYNDKAIYTYVWPVRSDN